MDDKILLELDIDELERRGINRYKAVLMAAQEARFINNQIRLDILKTDEKPTSMALARLFAGRVVEATEESDTPAPTA
jgi:DNA-directed RNA polymerase omega subunit